jgi:hypothetical protein
MLRRFFMLAVQAIEADHRPLAEKPRRASPHWMRRTHACSWPWRRTDDRAGQPAARFRVDDVDLSVQQDVTVVTDICAKCAYLLRVRAVESIREMSTEDGTINTGPRKAIDLLEQQKLRRNVADDVIGETSLHICNRSFSKQEFVVHKGDAGSSLLTLTGSTLLSKANTLVICPLSTGAPHR